MGRKMISLTKRKELKGYKSLKAYPEVAHFVTTRHGGISSGAYASFNCSPYTNDSSMNLIRNRHWLFQLMKWEIQELFIAEQRHGAASMVIDKWYFDTSEGIRQDLLIGIDALITNVPGYCVCVTTADCVPVLLYDKKLQVVAAIHAGWRGTVARIVEKTVSVMDNQYGSQGKDLIACIGPSISLEAFEVGDEVYQAFCEAGFDMNQIARKEAKWHIDLWEANRQQLLAYGVKPEHIEISGICTYHNNDDFFSARRQGIRSGRILSGILLGV